MHLKLTFILDEATFCPGEIVPGEQVFGRQTQNFWIFDTKFGTFINIYHLYPSELQCSLLFSTEVAFDVDTDTIRDAHSPFPSSVSKCLKGIRQSLRSPFWRVQISTFPFQRGVNEARQFLRNFGRKVILERQEAVLQGEDTPPDILAHILSVAEKEPSFSVEDMVDDFVTFFVAGTCIYLYMGGD